MDEPKQNSELTQLKRALGAIQDLRARLDEAEGRPSKPIAVIGIGCRFPGGAKSPSAYWELLQSGRDAIARIPRERWSRDDVARIDAEAAASPAIEWGGFLDSVDEFDPEFFGITPREANFMDPQQRLLLEVAWEALADAGQVVDKLVGSRTGVFIGVHSQSSDYQWLEMKSKSVIDVHTGTGTAHNVIAGRLSYLFDWHGPSIVVDTACSSSLVALHMAVGSLRAGECGMAIAGGVNLILSPEATVVCAKMNLLSSDGRCKAFDASANGIVRSEGCGVVVLKRLSDAIAERDPILGVIRGSAINQDGKTNGLTAPNGLSQQAVIRAALQNAGVGAAEIGYIEAHGTGTMLGDPIEIDSLANVLDVAGAGARRIVLSSAKANIGHLEGAAGIAGLIKAVLILRNETIPRQVHFERLNPHISLGDRLEIPTRAHTWPRGKVPRLAGVSSFGWSGTNAHVILEEAPLLPAGPARNQAAEAAYVLVLSAHTPEALRATAHEYQKFLSAGGIGQTLSLEDVCYTASARRTHQEFRLAVAGRSAKEMSAHLEMYLHGQAGAAVQTGRSREGGRRTATFALPELLPSDGSTREEALASLAKAFVAGSEIDWTNFFTDNAHCISLPAYAWQRKKYWFDRGEAVVPTSTTTTPASDLPGRRLRSVQPTFEMEIDFERFPYLADHRVHGVAVMPGAMYIEIACAVSCEIGLTRYPIIEDLELAEALVLAPRQTRILQTTLRTISAGAASFEIFSADAGSNESNATWIRHASGTIAAGSRSNVPANLDTIDISDLLARFSHRIAEKEFYRAIERQGVELNGAFQTIDRLGHRDGEALGRVRISDYAQSIAGYSAQAVLLDGALRVLLAATNTNVLSDAGDATAGHLIAGAESCHIFETLPCELWSYARLRDCGLLSRKAIVGDIDIFDRAGRRIAGLRGARMERSRAVKRPDWFYEMAWREVPLKRIGAVTTTREFTIAPQEVARRVEAADTHSVETATVAGTRAVVGQVEEVAAQFVVQALQGLGFEFVRGQRIEESSTASQLRILPRHRRLLRRLLEILAEVNILERVGSNWLVREAPAPANPSAACMKLANAHQEIRTELEILGRCGQQLMNVLRGNADPLQLLFPIDSRPGAGDLYEKSASARLYNSLMRDAIAAVVAGRLHDGLRVVEIGAGTGASTKFMLDALPSRSTEYLFTDVSKIFLTQAAERFAGRETMRFALLDIERDPADQEIAPHSFDIALAANVLHATRDLRATLAHVKFLLAPGGWLVFLEPTAPRRWVDLTFGLTEGWWKFTDANARASHPLLSPEKWITLLRDCGFENPAALGQVLSSGSLLEQTVFIARARRAAELEGHPTKSASRAGWLILGDTGAGIGERVANLLRARGDECSLLYAASVGGPPSKRDSLDPACRKDYERAIERAASNLHCPLRGILHLWGLDASCEAPDAAQKLVEAQRLGCESVMLLTQAIDTVPPSARPKLWLITRNAQPASGGSQELSVAQAPLWGMGRSIALEYPEAWGGLIDLDGGSQADQCAAHLVHEIVSASGEDQVALRGERRYVARLVPAAPVPSHMISIRSDGACLITGGLGGLGLMLAEWLARHGVGHLILVGRRGLGDQVGGARTTPSGEDLARRAAIRSIEAMGVRVDIEPVDVADRGAMREIVARLEAGNIPLRGVIHAATLFDVKLLREMDITALRAMQRAKIEGSWNLHELTQSLSLDFFVMFSSAQALFGSKASAHYAAHNQFLDALAHYRRARGLPALSIDWGEWEQMRGATAEQRRRVESSGWRPMSASLALDGMRDLIGAGVTQQMVASIDAEIVKAAYQIRGRRPFLDEIAVAHRGETRKEATTAEWLAQIRSVSPTEQKQALEAYVTAEVRRAMGVDASQTIEHDRGLFEMGLDSLMSVQLRSRLEAAISKSLPSTLIFNYPSIRTLTDFLADELSSSDNRASAVTPQDKAASVNGGRDEVADEIAHLSDQEVREQIASEVSAMQTRMDEHARRRHSGN